MVTEKRFKFDGDDENCLFKDGDKVLDCYEVVDVLNELYEQVNNDYNEANSSIGKYTNLSTELKYYETKCGSLEEGLFKQDREMSKLQKANRTLTVLIQNWENLNDEKDEQLEKMNESLKRLVGENQELKQEIENFKEWEKHIGDVKREDLDKVFKMSIYEIAEAFKYYRERIQELEE